ncbi:MAG: glycerate kinase [Lachnospiraceae bacterium]|nr:glycerate kinase [Lachnospiraceae bacterium]
MKVVVAVDSLKGSLSSMEAGNAVKRGIERVFPEAQVQVCPLADGGEGTVEALTAGMGGELVRTMVTGPLGKPVEAVYGILPGGKTAVMEMASAAGITLLSKEERNPLETTTYGVGELLRDAISRGCRSFIMGIGGSATNDGGMGMLQALGFEFLDEQGKPVPCKGRGLENLHSISVAHALPELSECSFRIACDVKNPLCGQQGCSVVFGPQKGADPEMIRLMDGWLEHYAKLTEKVLTEENWGRKTGSGANSEAESGAASSTAAETISRFDKNYPGTGAAGGLGFALRSYLGAQLESGIRIVLEETALEQKIREADLVVTGEGRLDAQTAMGKAPAGVAAMAKKLGKPVLAFSGCVTEDAGICNEKGIDAFFPILREVVSLEEALEPQRAAANMTATVEQVMRLVRLYR